MGFTIYYRSTRAVTQGEAEIIQQAADAASMGRTWLHCEPVSFFPNQEDKFLLGGSKPNFQPDPQDAASAAQQGLPDGTCLDMLDVLCRIGREHGIDWILSHDDDPNLGVIHAGICDPDVLSQIEAFAELADILDEFDRDAENPSGAAADPGRSF